MLETGEKRPRSGGVLTYQEINMQTYVHKAALITEIELQAKRFCDEFQTVAEADKDLLLEGVERTPAQMLVYQIGWMQLIQQWEAANRQGKSVITPHPDYKWNQLGGLYQYFYRTYAQQSLSALQKQFTENVTAIVALIDALDEETLFTPGKRQWASSTPANWPVWKWLHINTAAPFKTFRSKIRKWKRLRAP